MKKGRILVVDDLPDVRTTISGLLLDAGFDVKSSSGKEETLRLLRTELFHVAILDVRLDDSDEDNKEGLELMHEIRQHHPGIAVIILTGYADVKIVREALQPDRDGKSPAFGFLEKTELDQLDDYVARAMAHGKGNGHSDLKRLISQGENEMVEFKSSICWDYRTRAADKSIKPVIAKTIVGFLNSRGGTLLIGVSDNGSVSGIEKDLDTLPKRNLDGFQLELTNIISLYVGVEYLSNIHPRFETINNRTVCIVYIDKSPGPVFLKNDDNKLWVRASNSTRYLGVKAAMNYIETNWKKTG